MADLPPLPRLPGVPEAVQNELVEALKKLNPEQLSAFKELNRQKMAQQLIERRLYYLYPTDGPLRRELYKKHTAFFDAGAKYQERAFIAGNRVGKTLAVCYELSCHLVGWYPDWWAGRRFNRPVNAWAAGENAKAVRDSLQITLLGQPEAQGTGLIPKGNILSTTARAGVPDAIDTITVKYASGGISRCTLKGYDQGRESFQAAAVDVMVFDEEPPMSIYSEGVTRVLSTVPGQPSGIVMCSFTPLKGISDVVLSYLPNLGAVA